MGRTAIGDFAIRDLAIWDFVLGGLQTAGISAAFVLGGLLCAGLEMRVLASPAPGAAEARKAFYSRAPMDDAEEPTEELAPRFPNLDADRLWLVDGFNVLHLGLLRGRSRENWWSEPLRNELLAVVARFHDEEAPRGADAPIWVVWDGPRPDPAAAAGPVPQIFTPSADRWLLDQVRAAPAPWRIRVVTADRRLADRARDRGATVVAPHAFLARCRPT